MHAGMVVVMGRNFMQALEVVEEPHHLVTVRHLGRDHTGTKLSKFVQSKMHTNTKALARMNYNVLSVHAC